MAHHKAGFIMTLEGSDDDVPEEEAEEELQSKTKSGLSAAFNFDPGETISKPWDFDAARLHIRAQGDDKFRTSIDAKIQKTLKRKRDDEEQEADSGSAREEDSSDNEGSSEEEESSDESGSADEDMNKESQGADSSEESSEKIDLDEGTKEYQFKKKEKTKTSSFFEPAPVVPFSKVNSFQVMNISRPIMKAITELGWKEPTPIQRQVVPIALSGRDIAASAQTGSGKTAAFALPILERLLYRDIRNPSTRVLILLPTRELAAQCHSVVSKLSQYCNGITVALIVGGLSLQSQIIELQRFPDIVVATPGRILDHLRNSKSVGLDHLEILVMDEADRLLDMGFAEEVKEIVKMCPFGRHTMLFSATMTEEVTELMELSLNKPVRVSVDVMMQTNKQLTQEFVKIQQDHEEDRDAILLALCTRAFKSKVIIFFSQKVQAHRMKIIFGLVGLSAAELHGNLTQLQRLDALENFRDGKVNYLLATDVASRGLDIMGIQTIINYELPQSQSSYVHRVGRTARAGASGRSVSIITDSMGDRKLLKKIAKNTPKGQVVKNRTISHDILSGWRTKLTEMEKDIADVMRQEKEEHLLRVADRDATRAHNIIVHQEEIKSRPPRTWFISEKEKKEIKTKTKEALDPEKKSHGPANSKEQSPKLPTAKSGIPKLKKKASRKEKMRAEEKDNMLTPKQYNLARKKNAKLRELKKTQTQPKESRRNPPRPRKKQKIDHELDFGRGIKPKKQGGKFKSKKKHRRR